MSLKSFLVRIWAEVKSLFENLPIELQLAAGLAVNITENIKNFDTKNPEVADIITMIIPGEADDMMVSWLRGKIPIILTQLRLITSLKALTDPDEITKASINSLQGLDGDIKSAFLHDFSVLIAQEIAKLKGQVLKWSDAIYIIEWYYQHKIKTA